MDELFCHFRFDDWAFSSPCCKCPILCTFTSLLTLCNSSERTRFSATALSRPTHTSCFVQFFSWTCASPFPLPLSWHQRLSFSFVVRVDKWISHWKVIGISHDDNLKESYTKEWEQEVHVSDSLLQKSHYHWKVLCVGMSWILWQRNFVRLTHAEIAVERNWNLAQTMLRSKVDGHRQHSLWYKETNDGWNVLAAFSSANMTQNSFLFSKHDFKNSKTSWKRLEQCFLNLDVLAPSERTESEGTESRPIWERILELLLPHQSIVILIRDVTFPSKPKFCCHNYASNSVLGERRPSILSWSSEPRRGRARVIEEHITDKWHVSAHDAAIEFLQHECLTNHSDALRCFCLSRSIRTLSLGHYNKCRVPPRC